MAEDPSVVYFQCCRIGTVPKLGMYMHACFVALWAKTSDTLCVMWPCLTFQRACLANSVFVNLKGKKKFHFLFSQEACFLLLFVCVCVCVCVLARCLLFLNLLQYYKARAIWGPPILQGLVNFWRKVGQERNQTNGWHSCILAPELGAGQ